MYTESTYLIECRDPGQQGTFLYKPSTEVPQEAFLCMPSSEK